MIHDHSICGDVISFHRRLRECVKVPLGAVPIYEIALRNNAFSDQEALSILDEYLERGFNILTIHATVLLRDLKDPLSEDRLIPITSKGGKLMLARMQKTGKENPFFAHFSEVLDIFKKHHAVISLGSTYRPASVFDNSMDENDAYWVEIKRMSKLVEMAITAEVQIMIEGIGHARMEYIYEYVTKTKRICFHVPYRVLTVSTDIALGYDNISSAIASALAVKSGADVVTAVSSAEHISLPSIEQVIEGVVSSRIAIHSAMLDKPSEMEKNRQMSLRRYKKGCCQGDIEFAIYRNGAEKALLGNLQDEGCTMCGDLCALKIKRDKEEK
jgi:phosphomethylpyrimidine synthase